MCHPEEKRGGRRSLWLIVCRFVKEISAPLTSDSCWSCTAIFLRFFFSSFFVCLCNCTESLLFDISCFRQLQFLVLLCICNQRKRDISFTFFLLAIVDIPIDGSSLCWRAAAEIRFCCVRNFFMRVCAVLILAFAGSEWIFSYKKRKVLLFWKSSSERWLSFS